MKTMKICMIAILIFITLLQLIPFISVFRGKAAMLKNEGTIEVVINGTCKSTSIYSLEIHSLPIPLRKSHALEFDTMPKKVAVVLDVPGMGMNVFWLADSKIGVTQSATQRHVSCFFNHWLIVSETALNCTYDVQDDMKGLKADVRILRSSSDKSYHCHFELDKKSVDLKFLLPAAPSKSAI